MSHGVWLFSVVLNSWKGRVLFLAQVIFSLLGIGGEVLFKLLNKYLTKRHVLPGAHDKFNLPSQDA